MPRTKQPRGPLLQIFARNLQAQMDKKGWNQSETARQASLHLPAPNRKSKKQRDALSRDNVSTYCRAKALPTPKFLHALATAFNCDPTDLLPTRGYPAPAEDTPAWDLKNLGDGNAWLRVNQRVPMALALKIVEMVNAVPETPPSGKGED